MAKMTTMDDQAAGLEHEGSLPVTRRQCHESHEAMRRFTMWLAGLIFVACVGIGSFTVGLATANASLVTRVEAQDRMVSAIRDQASESRQEIMTRFDRIESKIDSHISMAHRNP